MAPPLQRQMDIFRALGSSGGAGLPGRTPVQPSTIAQPPKPPKGTTPPVQKTTVRRDKAGPPGKPPASSSLINSSPNTTLGGLPTTGKLAAQPFNPFAMPKTIGQFNQEVNQAALPAYQPQLQQTDADMQAENEANKQRVADINSIYSQYGNQAQQAFNETQSALQSIINQENAGNGAASGYLQAALGSALGGPNSLGQMMGMSPQAPAAETAPYMATAANETQAGKDYLGALAAGETAGQGQNLANVGIEQASQANTESQRHGAEVQSITANRDAIVQQIPSLVEKAREQLISDLENGQNISFQERLANKEFGLSKQAQNANIANTKATLRMNQLNSAANRQNAASQTALNRQQIKINEQTVQEKATADRAKLAQALAKAQGQQQANAIKYLQGWVTPSKLAITPGHYVTNPNTGTRTYVPPSLKPGYHLDPGSALREIMNAYGLDERTALSLMTGLSSPIGGSQGTMTVGEWARTFLQRSAQNIANGVLNNGGPQQLVQVPPNLITNRLSPNPPYKLRG